MGMARLIGLSSTRVSLAHYKPFWGKGQQKFIVFLQIVPGVSLPPRGRVFWGQVPRTWGTSFEAKRGPPRPPKSPKGGKFRFFPPLETPFQRPREGDCGPPPIGSLPKLSFRRIGDLRPALCGRARHMPLGCYEVQTGGFLSFVRTAPGGFPKGRARRPRPLVKEGVARRGTR